jgi:hypothetical protein
MDPDESLRTEDDGTRGEESEPEGAAPIDFYEEEEDEAEYFERMFAQKKAEDETKQVAVRIALGKFNAFLHLTMYAAGVAYFILLGVLYSPALPYVFIPIALWTVGISYHLYRAFVLGSPPKPKKDADAGEGDEAAIASAGDLDDQEDEESE